MKAQNIQSAQYATSKSMYERCIEQGVRHQYCPTKGREQLLQKQWSWENKAETFQAGKLTYREMGCLDLCFLGWLFYTNKHCHSNI